MSYEERLRVPWWWWCVPLFFLATLWLAVWAALGPIWASAVTLVACGVVAWTLISYGSAPVVVRNGELRAGRARVPVGALGRVDPLSPEAARDLRGPKGNGRAYMVLRAYIGTAVRAEIIDPGDPTPYWFISTRHPRELASALQEEKDRTSIA